MAVEFGVRVRVAPLRGSAQVSAEGDATFDFVVDADALERWRDRGLVPHPSESDTANLRLAELAIEDLELAGLPWELLIRDLGLLVVRTSVVPPRVAQVPLTVPLRLLAVDAPRTDLAILGIGVEGRSCSARDVEQAVWDHQWPNVDVLHIAGFGDEDMLDLAHPETPRTAAWVERVLQLHQVRLLVLDCPPHRLPTARRLALDLADRGGPAIAVIEGDNLALAQLLVSLVTPNMFDNLYEYLVGRVTLVGGHGRLALLDMSDVLRRLERMAAERPTRGRDDLLDVLVSRREYWRALEGTPQLSDALRRDVAHLRWLAGAERARRVPDAFPEDERRYLVPTLTQQGLSGLQHISQHGEPLLVDAPIQLQARLGPEDPSVEVLDAVSLVDEIFSWDPEDGGTWVELGLTGIDSDILGADLQQLWVPRSGPSQTATFTVIPRADISYVRLAIYVEQNVAQTILISMLGRGPSMAESTEAREAIADQLRLAGRTVPEALPRWVARVEYTLLSDMSGLGEVPARAASFVVNHLGRGDVVTVKYPGGQAKVRTDGIAAAGATVRRALEQISTVKGIGEGAAAPERYRFESEAPRDPTVLLGHLKSLAVAGRALFDLMIPGKARDLVSAAIQSDGLPVHVANLLVQKAVPWAAVYDRPIRQLTAEHLCTAALPDESGVSPDIRCGEDPACVLRGDGSQDGPQPRNVVCPRGFWGFRQHVEAPVQRTNAGQLPADAARATAKREPKRVGLAVYRQLALGGRHHDELVKLLNQAAPPAEKRWDADSAQALLDSLDDDPVDLIYLISHADADEGTDGQAGSGRVWYPDGAGRLLALTRTDFEGAWWPHRPLVILNGCRTAASDPTAISVLMQELTADRGAGGAIGTEIAVWEQLACTVGEILVERFLAGDGAGDALLAARRRLLGAHNPLGLAYSLYATAEFQAITESAGEPEPEDSFALASA